MFEAPARIALKCDRCQLDIARLERGARFAGLLTMIIAVLLIMLAVGIDIWLTPPFWLQVVFWAPVTVLAVIGFLRFYKTTLIYRQYQTQSQNGDL